MSTGPASLDSSNCGPPISTHVTGCTLCQDVIEPIPSSAATPSVPSPSPSVGSHSSTEQTHHPMITRGKAGNQPQFITSCISSLNHELSIKDLDELSYFLGLVVIYTNDDPRDTYTKFTFGQSSEERRSKKGLLHLRIQGEVFLDILPATFRLNCVVGGMTQAPLTPVDNPAVYHHYPALPFVTITFCHHLHPTASSSHHKQTPIFYSPISMLENHATPPPVGLPMATISNISNGGLL
ncbi:unnamed protein product [Lactuca saligna]|uniref:Uncharacterized protein n=1 Tax=Lactuca saligna TaxID=75948 RepID=A0AA35ZF06_LACSI|nr:unnamed protein product [Lactuca saligna]